MVIYILREVVLTQLSFILSAKVFNITYRLSSHISVGIQSGMVCGDFFASLSYDLKCSHFHSIWPVHAHLHYEIHYLLINYIEVLCGCLLSCRLPLLWFSALVSQQSSLPRRKAAGTPAGRRCATSPFDAESRTIENWPNLSKCVSWSQHDKWGAVCTASLDTVCCQGSAGNKIQTAFPRRVAEHLSSWRESTMFVEIGESSW